jgi:CRP-like cAMP-binding protein
MKSVPLDKLKAGMVLADDLAQGAQTLYPKSTVLTEKHIEKLKKYDFPQVWVDDSDEQKEKIASESPKAVSSLNKRVYAPGQYVCVQGERSECLYILVSGELDVIYTDESMFEDNMEGVDRIPKIQQHGKRITSIKGKMVNFGELGAILGENRTATICASQESIVASISAVGESFNNTVLKNPKLGLNISITIAKRLKDINNYISKYNAILSQADNMVKEYSMIYMTVADCISRQAVTTKEKGLYFIHEQIKQSPLYNRLFKFKRHSIDSGSMSRRKSPSDGSDDSFFSHGQVENKGSGEIICYHGEVGDKMYVLIVGKVGVFIGDKMVASYETKGDMIGEVSVLLGYASKNKGFDRRTATVKAISRSRLLSIQAKDLDEVVKSNPPLILHITKTIAERLRASNQVFIEAQRSVGEYLDKLAVKRGSCGYEIDRVLSFFNENPNLIYICSTEVKLLNRISASIKTKYSELKEKLTQIS